MKKDRYIEYGDGTMGGATKMVDIDFSILYPSSSFFVSVNMLVEFSSKGQVVPTRIDIMPYKLSAFATYNTEPTATIDSLKMLLVIYTCYAVLVNCQSYSMQKLFSTSAIWDNLTDLMIIFLQTYSFFIKMSDADTFDLDP